MQISLKRLDPDLPLPRRAHPGDAGVDLQSAVTVSLLPGERKTIATGIAIAIPDGYAGLVTPRSGLAARHGLSIVNTPGLVDSGYRGELRIALINLGDEKVDIIRGDRIAQLVITPVETAEFVEVEDLPDSSRGDGGFGSTGS